MDTLFAPVYDANWGRINPSHRAMITRFLGLCPASPRVLDAACGTGKYWPMLQQAGAQIVGVDQSGGMLRQAGTKFPDVLVQRLGLQDLCFVAEFDGAICVDAMENVFPEDWPVVLANLIRAVRPGGPVYLTVELAEDDLEDVYASALAAGEPVVPGEYLKDGGYHYYPELSQVRDWADTAGAAIVADLTTDGYYSLLLRGPGPTLCK
ncbi:MAG TPA: class I SAM-dependent methyltransferase [Streptosporangiaceae bacterium]|nr:class I SAM-dependent methyltransferase [Streptosporangiaceae bacterium]